MQTSHILINGDCRKMSLIQDESIHLIVTSPPYWQLKDYGSSNQIGFNDTYEQYINNLNLVWKECYRVLHSGCRLCINIGDQFARTAYYGRYKIIPIHSEIIRFCETIGFDYLGSIIWQKPTSMHPSGGEKVMGSFPNPRGGIVKIDFEQILLFKKLGKAPHVNKEQKETSKLSLDEWNEYFSSHWTFSGAKQNRHIAVFPEELPKRLIKMFSFVGDTILDPFMGSGTTAIAALNQNRNSIGYEINIDFRLFYKEKVVDATTNSHCRFEFHIDNSVIPTETLIKELPYQFVDVHQFSASTDIKANTYGSKIEIDESVVSELKSNTQTSDLKNDMVLVNHSRKETKQLMIEKGICYLRAGDSKGSLLVSPGFERMQYVLLHTGGEDCHLFRLKTKGHFQIWTRETLEQYGFHPKHAPYYVVLHFDNSKEIEMPKQPNLKQKINTYRAKIRPLSDFFGLN